MTNLPRLELTEDHNKKNDFIIFRKQLKGNRTTKGLYAIKSLSNKTHRNKQKHHKKTKKHRNRRKRKSVFNIFT
jgi:hypothetical protein